jgi:hypothetical protein
MESGRISTPPPADDDMVVVKVADGDFISVKYSILMLRQVIVHSPTKMQCHVMISRSLLVRFPLQLGHSRRSSPSWPLGKQEKEKGYRVRTGLLAERRKVAVRCHGRDRPQQPSEHLYRSGLLEHG